MEPIRTNDPALQDPTTPVARQGAPEYPATSNRRQPAPNQLQSAESAVPPAQHSGAEGANDQTSNPPSF